MVTLVYLPQKLMGDWRAGSEKSIDPLNLVGDKSCLLRCLLRRRDEGYQAYRRDSTMERPPFVVAFLFGR